MTTAFRHFLRYRLSAATTTAVTVVPSALAFSTAAVHTSSGIRSERGMVATSERLRDARPGANAGPGSLAGVGHVAQRRGARKVAPGLGGVRFRADVRDDLGGAGGGPGGLLGGDVHGALRSSACIYTLAETVSTRNPSTGERRMTPARALIATVTAAITGEVAA